MERADVACVMEQLSEIEPATGIESVTLIDHGPEEKLEIVLVVAPSQHVGQDRLRGAEHQIERTLKERSAYPKGARIAGVRVRNAVGEHAPRPTRGAEQWSGQRCAMIARDLHGEGAGDAGQPPWPQARHYEVSIEGRDGRCVTKTRRWADDARAAAVGVDPERSDTARKELRHRDDRRRGPLTVRAVRIGNPAEQYWRVYPGTW